MILEGFLIGVERSRSACGIVDGIMKYGILLTMDWTMDWTMDGWYELDFGGLWRERSPGILIG
ncbi:hypothetical protein BPAE_0235g00020 [Botrytis paeoniae]|uniref:Uncharacterized protein n=1 Tax=Botrytis paeoniae TaxID=278948 RepID=A0A4Z1FEN2_9HELO|nr:hypothetical protein BPAE_0235g00020 [Botrytis paeoniae]